MKTTTEFAPAKINLSLTVGPRDGHGYHGLESLVVFANVGDHLTFKKAPDLRLTLDGPFASGLDAGPDNLVLRAARALMVMGYEQKGAHITLHKALPVSSGIGGGSADAAAALRGLNRLWRCGLDDPQLEALGRGLGADVPVCVQSRTRYMRGYGEILDDVEVWPELDAVLVNPGFAVSTKAVFAHFDTLASAAPLPIVQTFKGTRHVSTALTMIASFANDLTSAACDLAPTLGPLLEHLNEYPRAYVVRLCGAGASCIVLTGSAIEATGLAKEISNEYSQFWVQPVNLSGTANFSSPETLDAPIP